MSEANFEKNVQQEMLGFKIKPSEEVWTKVEERIRKKKRKRFFFLLFFAGLALLGYWQRDILFNEKEPAIFESVSTAPQEISSNEKIKTKEKDNLNDEIIVKENLEKEKDGIKKDVPIFNKEQKSEGKQSTVSIKKESTPGNISEIAKQETKKTPEEINTDLQKANTEKLVEMRVATNASDLVKVVTEKKEIENKEGLEIRMDTTAMKEKEKIIEKEIEKINDYKMPDENKVQIDSIQKSGLKADSVTTLKRKPVISKKWKWGVEVTPGISSFADQLLSVSSQKSADFLNAPPTGGISNPPASPSKKEPGFALQLRGFVQRKIAKKTQLSLGLQYSFYSDRILIGSRRDSILNYAPQSMTLNDASRVYGTANSFSNYTNRYHFIELPVEFHFQLNKNSKNPFYLNLGLTAGQLISSNALVYDTAFGGIYFDGKKQLNKTQFSLSTGLLWTVSSKKAEWSVGPVVNVHLNRFLDNPFENNQYLFMPGLRTKIIFPRKN